MIKNQLLDSVRTLIKNHPNIAPGAEPGEMRMTPRGVWIEFYYPAIIEGDCEIISFDVFDLMRDSEAFNESKTR